jgi:hypothetical protein
MTDEMVWIVDPDDEAPGEGEQPRGERWSAAQQLAIAALAAGGSYGEAAGVAGVTSRTITRWMAMPEFRAEVQRQRSARVSRLSGLLLDAGDDAVGVLREELRADRSMDRVRAAALLLSHGLRFRQHVDLEDRLAEIERRLGIIDDETGDESVEDER